MYAFVRHFSKIQRSISSVSIYRFHHLLQEEKTSECRIIEGRFLTPMELYLPGLVPKESLDAHFQLILPLKWKDENYKPICVHLAGTGDHVCSHFVPLVLHRLISNRKTLDYY